MSMKIRRTFARNTRKKNSVDHVCPDNLVVCKQVRTGLRLLSSSR